jgi:hypothetical protein
VRAIEPSFLDKIEAFPQKLCGVEFFEGDDLLRQESDNNNSINFGKTSAWKHYYGMRRK